MGLQKVSVIKRSGKIQLNLPLVIPAEVGGLATQSNIMHAGVIVAIIQDGSHAEAVFQGRDLTAESTIRALLDPEDVIVPTSVTEEHIIDSKDTLQGFV